MASVKDAPLAVGVFHIFGHQPSCQVTYHPRTCDGLGLSDGESLERLWSFLNGYVSSTKYMSPENRMLMLTLGLDYYTSKNW